MFTNDYLMRMILRLVQALTRSLNVTEEEDRQSSIESLENTVSDAINIDPELLYSLSPDSMVAMLDLGDFDERLGGYVVRSLYRIADLYDEQGLETLGDLRRSQAEAINQRWNIELTADESGLDELQEFLAQNK